MANTLDMKIRVADEKLPLAGIATDVTEFDRDGLVYEKNGVKVIAFEVDHGDIIRRAFRRSRNTSARREVDWQSSPAGYVNEGTAETASDGGLLPPIKKGRKETILTARS